MAKIKVGEIFPDFVYDTPFETGKHLKDEVKGVTALMFLRYYGCSLCRFDLHDYKVNYDKITAAGGKLIAVIQSEAAYMKEEIPAGEYPYDIVCDPDCLLYDKFDIPVMAEGAKFEMTEKAAKIFGKIKELGYEHGKYEGRETQLPAAFILDGDMKVIYAHYAKDMTDLPDAAEIVELMK
ncbi:MAG: redoxin domain-containing protein [Eubacteriaceae bacterium]|jgi:peroxiredoxin|nr:redoxin domain-containing protein [Eubacteriaceae bacterium]